MVTAGTRCGTIVPLQANGQAPCHWRKGMVIKMKKLKLWIVLFTTAAVLCACGGKNDIKSPIILDEEPLTSEAEDNPSDEASTLPGDVVSEDDSVPPHEGMVRSPLTNEWVEKEVAETRPIAVMTPNQTEAIPHYNLSKASILYEAPVEGRYSRLMAIYDDWEDLEKIGNVRSLRSYYAYWAFEWDAFIVHFGGPFFINELIDQPNTQNINGLMGSDDAAFFRSKDREMPHNAYVSGEGIKKVIDKKGYDLSYRGLADQEHFKFVSKAEPNTLEQYGDKAKTATYIDMSGCYPLTRCYFEYNEEDGLYYRSQHLAKGTDGPHIDAVSGEQLSFKNILVQNIIYEDLGKGYLALQCHDSTEDGYYFTNGKGIHVTWEKTSDYGATTFYDDNGNEIALNTGKTMICVVEKDDSFSYH